MGFVGGRRGGGRGRSVGQGVVGVGGGVPFVRCGDVEYDALVGKGV